MAKTFPPHLLGLWVSGDIGPLTIYTDRHGRKVFYPRSPPKEPPTARQVLQRERFKQARSDWNALSREDKERLELASNRCNLCMTGQNIWLTAALTGNTGWYETLGRQAHLTLPTLIIVP